jgi:hypothetical protein
VVGLGHLKDGKPQCLAGNCAGVRARAADAIAALDDGDRLAMLGGLHRRPFTTGPAADHDHVEMIVIHECSGISCFRCV